MSALTIKKLCKSFGGLHVTTNVDLNVAPGERRLIIGPNGAGKTTLFNLITGELTPDSGSIKLFGQDITHVPSRRRAHLGMARTYQIITLFPNDTIQSKLPDPEWLERWLDEQIQFNREWEQRVSRMILKNLSLLFGQPFETVQQLNRFRKSLAAA